MTNINPKLTAALTTVALLAPAAGAQAATYATIHPARHVAISTPARHWSTDHARRSTAKFQRDTRNWA